MNYVTRIWLALPVAALLAACGGDADVEGSADSAEALQIAVIPKGTTHEFWRSIHAGAQQAAEELTAAGTPVEIIWKGPLREDDREQQVQVVEGFLAQGIDGIVLAPLDDRALVRPVEEARQANVPTVIMDSGLQSNGGAAAGRGIDSRAALRGGIREHPAA
jgi:ribose transport system substrate-binding protein